MKIKQNQSVNDTNMNQMATQMPIKTGDTTFVDGLKDLDMINSMREGIDANNAPEVSVEKTIEEKSTSAESKINEFCKSNINYVAKNDVKKEGTLEKPFEKGGKSDRVFAEEDKTLDNKMEISKPDGFAKTKVLEDKTLDNKMEISKPDGFVKTKVLEDKTLDNKMEISKSDDFTHTKVLEDKILDVKQELSKLDNINDIKNVEDATDVKNISKNEEKLLPKMVMEEILPKNEISRKNPQATVEEFDFVQVEDKNSTKNEKCVKNNDFSELEKTIQTLNDLPKKFDNKIGNSEKTETNKTEIAKVETKEVSLISKVKNFEKMKFSEQKNFINSFIKLENKDFKPINDKKLVGKIMTQLQKEKNKTEARNEVLTPVQVKNVLNSVINLNNKEEGITSRQPVLDDDILPKNIDNNFNEVKLSVEDFEPENVKAQLKPQIDDLEAVKSELKTDKVEIKQNNSNDLLNKILNEENDITKEIPKMEEVIPAELRKPVVKNSVDNKVDLKQPQKDIKHVENIQNKTAQPKVEQPKLVEKNIDEKKDLNINQKSTTSVINSEQKFMPEYKQNVELKSQRFQVQKNFANSEVKNVKNVIEKQPEIKPVEDKQLKNMEQKPVDYQEVKNIEVKQEVKPQPKMVSNEKPVVDTKTFTTPERVALEPEKKQPLEDLNKFLNEIMSEDTVESLKSKDVSMIDDNTLLTEEIKNYYNLNKAKNLDATEDVKNVINERIAEIDDLASIVETAQEAKSIQKELKSLNVQNIQPKKVETKQLKMTEQDANFFIELVKNNQETSQTLTDTTTQSLQNLQELADDVQQSTKVSKALSDMLSEAMKTNKPFRIDFDKNISVIIKIDREGKISAEFLPGDKAVEQYLRTQLPMLRQKFSDENIDYKDLNYRQSNGGRQNRERKRRGE